MTSANVNMYLENHRTAQFGRDLKRPSGPAFHGKSKPRWDYLAPCPTASWNLLMMATLPCPWGHCYRDWCYCEILLSNIKMKPLLRKSVPVASCLLHVAPCEERVSMLFVPTLWVLKHCEEAPTCLIEDQKTWLLQSIPMGQVLQHSDHLHGPTFDPLSSVLVFFECGDQNWTQYSRCSLTMCPKLVYHVPLRGSGKSQALKNKRRVLFKP